MLYPVKAIMLTVLIFSFLSPFSAQESCVDLTLIGEQDFTSNVDYPAGSVLYSENGINFIKLDDAFVTSEGGDFLHWANGIIIDVSELPFENKSVRTNYAIGYELVVEIDGEEVFNINSVLSIGEDSTVVSSSNVELEMIRMGNNHFDFIVSGAFNSLTVISSSGGIFEACSEPLFSNTVDELELPLLTLFPNPVSKELFINGDFQEHPVLIYDLKGELVIRTLFTSGESINVEELAAGSYIIIIEGAKARFNKQ